MKQRSKYVMLVISAAVLAGAWLAASSMDGANEQGTPTPDASPEPIGLAVGSREEITALSWSWDGQMVNLARSGPDGRWENADDPECPVDAAAAEALARAAASTSASMAVENVTDMAQYGLQPAQLTVIAATAERAATYEVGHMSITGEYYVRLDGENTVYLENGSLAAFRVGLTGLLALESIPADISAVTGLSVTSEAGDYEIEYLSEDGQEAGWYRTDGDMTVLLSGERVRALLELPQQTELTRCVGWSAADAAAYGMDEPQLTATLRYEDGEGREQEFSLVFGSYCGDEIYVSFAGSGLIYLTPAAGPDGLMFPDWDRLAPAALLTLDTEAVASIELEIGGEKSEILRLEEETERAVGDETVTVRDVIYSSGGIVLDTGRVEDWLRALANLPAEPASGAGAGRETLLSVTLMWKDAESVPAEVELRSYDSGRCLCILGGDRYLLVSRGAAEDVIARAQTMLEHE